MRRLILAVAAIFAPALAQAQTVWVIDHADSSGFSVAAPHEYLAKVGMCARLDSALTSLENLVAGLSRAEARREFFSLTATGAWSIYLDVEGFLPSGDDLFTNVNEDGADCPRTFISASVLLDSQRSDCLKRASLMHEWRHVHDMVSGRAPKYIFRSGEAELTWLEDVELLEFEYRGYCEQLAADYAGGCADEDSWYRVYRQGGAYRLRLAIAQAYGIFDRHPDKRELIRHVCAWVPWEL